MGISEKGQHRRSDERFSNSFEDEQLMTASGDVTAALQRAVQSMSTELEKSSYSAQLLDESSMTIQQATLQYTSFADLMASSRKLIASMERADMWDAAMLLLAFAFYAGCVLYILKVRIWDRGVGVLSFALRMSGLVSSRSPADVKEKLALAKEAAKSSRSAFAARTSSSAIAAQITSSAILSKVVSSASATQATYAIQSAPRQSFAGEPSLLSLFRCDVSEQEHR